MNLTNFAPSHKVTDTATPFADETFNLAGLNLTTPDEVMPAGESPYTINSRMFAREDGQSRVASRTRHGSTRLSVAIGETLDTQNTAAATTAYPYGWVGGVQRILAQPFTPSSSGLLTRADLETKLDSGAFGYSIVQICADNAGVPGSLLATSSVNGGNATTSFAFLAAYFMDAPALVSGTQYWLVVYLQDNGGTKYNFYLNQTAAAGGLQSINGGSAWSSVGSSFRYKTYLSTAGGVKGATRRYPSTGTVGNRTLIATNGVVTAYDSVYNATIVTSGLTPSAKFVRFCQLNDNTYYCNGVDAPRQWDGTTDQAVANAPNAAALMFPYKNRMFYLTANVRFDFSALNDPTSISNVNFFYVPNPKSSDPVTGSVTFKNERIIFTNATKYLLLGSDISTFQLNEALGTKGAVSQEAIAVAPGGVYFMASDHQIYFYNGAVDSLVSAVVMPELENIQDLTKVRLHYYNNQLRVYYQKAPDTSNNRMLLYDLVYKQWFMDTGRLVAGSLALTQDKNELIEYSSLAGWLFFGEQGYSDLGKPIDYKYWTNYKVYSYRKRYGGILGGATAKKRIKRFRPFVRVVTNDFDMLVGKDVDYQNAPDMRTYSVKSSGAKWGQFVWGDGTKWGASNFVMNKAGMSGRGNHVQYRFERNGVETPVELLGYTALIRVGVQR